jgi:hypothetical protein
MVGTKLADDVLDEVLEKRRLETGRKTNHPLLFREQAAYNFNDETSLRR